MAWPAPFWAVQFFGVFSLWGFCGLWAVLVGVMYCGWVRIECFWGSAPRCSAEKMCGRDLWPAPICAVHMGGDSYVGGLDACWRRLGDVACCAPRCAVQKKQKMENTAGHAGNSPKDSTDMAWLWHTTQTKHPELTPIQTPQQESSSPAYGEAEPPSRTPSHPAYSRQRDST